MTIHQPAHLKPLFLYLAIVPEDRDWSSKDLIEMWIAEGFVADDQIGRCETLEDKGMQFISELAQRYIIRVRRRNLRDEVEHFYLHDIMREFCIKTASKCQFLENISPTSPCGRRPNKARRVSIFSKEEHCLEENNYLRTLVYNGLSYQKSDRVAIKKLESIHEDFKLLRVLKISWCSNKTMPKQIGNLIHLTYLSVTNTQISVLPESVRNLHNLIYLKFLSPSETKVPDDLVVNMENLRVLELPCNLLKSGSSKGLGFSERHKKLYRLTCGAGRLMKDLPVMHLLTLRELHLIAIEDIEEMEAIHQFMSFLNGNLQTLDLAISAGKELKFDTEKLIGMQSMHTISLDGPLVNNGTIQFPPNLVSLDLDGSEIGEGVDLMGVLGHLSNLKYLFMWNNTYVGRQVRCTSSSFPKLEGLSLSSLYHLEEWSMEDGAMSRLSRIDIDGCAKLKRLPQGIRSITTLKELHIRNMPEEFCWRLGYKRDENAIGVRTQGGEDSYIIQHIPSVKLDFIRPQRLDQ